ncbi:hypothetical protein Syun_005674 [Stephania yunnanensis]|uniref:NAD-dependent epimerase/dehydratase domain-containing protein n=1 Tax=Stephania yunnanensis TaxID=152371 RepID=A0AAP0L552_9MAGN
MDVKDTMCVTGAGGYQASWVVKLLLSHGYKVHGTVRDPCDPKNAHLEKLENASENLQLFKADLLDFEGLCKAIDGCTGVFHVACPVPSSPNIQNPEVDLVKPAVEGTSNVLKACTKAKVKRVVMVSSVAAVVLNPNWPKDQLMDETCWTDKDLCVANHEIKALGLNWYSLAKTEAESLALEYAKESKVEVVTVCPPLIIGPMLQSKINSSSMLLLTIARDGLEKMEYFDWTAVDVRDVAEALLMLYTNLEAKGRYICSSYSASTSVFIEKLRSLYPNHNYPKQISGEGFVCKLSSEKLRKLGWKNRPLEETLVDTIEDYYEKGLLNKP